ncbi:hypothetical protein [Roseibium sp.]|uniref:hypothetical protein n=1 Tax=Roseibium sp. TaxID=1936156 RepID=UPI003D0A5301
MAKGIAKLMMLAKIEAKTTSEGKPGEEIVFPDKECRNLKRGRKKNEYTDLDINDPESCAHSFKLSVTGLKSVYPSVLFRNFIGTNLQNFL